MAWRILLCNDGSRAAATCEAMLRALRLIPGADLEVLGVLEPRGDHAALEARIASMVSRLTDEGVSARPVFRRGHAAEEILLQAEAEAYDVVVTGAHGHRGLTRFLLGSTSSRLARHLRTSLLVCRRSPERVERILICSGGESPALATLQSGGRIAALASAEVTLLHVMSQVALSWESPADDLADTAERAMARNSREGLHLRQGIEMLRQAGLAGEPRAVLRHGLVVDEVVAEIEAARAQLLIIGAHRTPQASHAFAPLLDDITDQLLTHAPCSVWIVRPQPSGGS